MAGGKLLQNFVAQPFFGLIPVPLDMGSVFASVEGMWRIFLTILVTGWMADARTSAQTSAPPSAANTATNAVAMKFRAAVRLPQVAFNLEPQFGRNWGVTAEEDIADPQAELIQLSAGLKNVPSEAPLRLRLHRLALLVGDTNALAHRDAAIAGFRTLAQANPADPIPAVGLARILWQAGQDDAAEVLLRTITEKFPQHWPAWILLGETLASRSLKVFTEWGTNAPPNPLAAYVAGVLKPQGDAQAARSLFDESIQCLDKAAKLAPEDPKMWAARLPFLLDREMRRRVLADPAAPQDRQAAVSLVNQAAAAPDVEAVLARLPDDYRLLGLSIYLRILPELAEARVRLGINQDGSRAVDSLRSNTRAWVRERQARLESLATNDVAGAATSPSRRAGAAEMAAAYQYVLWANASAAERLARLSLELDPSRQRAMELVVAGLVNTRRWSELESLCEQRLRAFDSPLPRLLLAKAQFNAGRKEAALTSLAAASEKFPQHRLLLAGLLAARLAVPGTPEDPNMINRLRQLFPDPANSPDDTDANHSVVISALISQALDGQFATAKRVLRSLVIADPSDDYASVILDLVRENETP